MKLLVFSTIISIVGSCSNPSYNEKVEALKDSIVFEDIEAIERFSSTITTDELKKSVYTLASDSLEGRKTGKIGHHKAAQFLKDFYQREAISSPLATGDYFQDIPE